MIYNIGGNFPPLLSEVANFTPILSEIMSLISLTFRHTHPGKVETKSPPRARNTFAIVIIMLQLRKDIKLDTGMARYDKMVLIKFTSKHSKRIP